MNENTMKWTKFSDAMPTGAFYVWCKRDGVDIETWTCADDATDLCFTHWHPAPPLPEPPKEETQGERDEAAMAVLWANTWQGDSNQVAMEFGRKLLAWERGEIAKLLPESPIASGSQAYYAGVRAVRDRCSNGGGK